jgi:hypothetical protein
MIVRVSAAALVLGAALSAAPAGSIPTYAKDVAPILYQRCVECHRQGEAAPMALTTYQETRPWAKAIKQAVLQHVMPPWLADSHFGAFRNARSVPQKDVETLVAWADGGAPEGNAKDTPAIPHFETGWNIGKPDVIIDIGKDFDVPVKGTLAYQYFTVPTNFTEDKWIEAAEIRPDQRSAIHHVIVFVQDASAQPGQRREVGNLLVGYAPGEQPLLFEPGTAKLVKAGSKFLFQMHYTPNGKAVKDRSYVGLKFAKEAPKFRAITANAATRDFAIPPGDGNYPVKSTWTAKQDLTLLGLMPHMHLRGKDFKYTVVYPDGREEVILNVPKYDFNWQLEYQIEKPLELPKGTRIDCIAHFDNSPNNKYNPDPSKEVKWGDQTWEEMMIGWFTYRVPNVPAAAPVSNAVGNP